MAGSYIVAGARTPIGKMSGALSSFSAADLGGFAIKAALERAGVKPEEVEQLRPPHLARVVARLHRPHSSALMLGIRSCVRCGHCPSAPPQPGGPPCLVPTSSPVPVRPSER